MSGLEYYKSQSLDEVEIDLVPIMNTFLVLVPFLLLSAAFYHLKAINTSVPILAETSQGSPLEIGKAIKVTAVMEIKGEEIHLSAISDSLNSEELSRWDAHLVKEQKSTYPLDQVIKHLQKLKGSYPSSDTLIILPEESILYDTIIQAMDAARYCGDKALFPRVVLSGKVS